MLFIHLYPFVFLCLFCKFFFLPWSNFSYCHLFPLFSLFLCIFPLSLHLLHIILSHSHLSLTFLLPLYAYNFFSFVMLIPPFVYYLSMHINYYITLTHSLLSPSFSLTHNYNFSFYFILPLNYSLSLNLIFIHSHPLSLSSLLSILSIHYLIYIYIPSFFFLLRS